MYKYIYIYLYFFIFYLLVGARGRVTLWTGCQPITGPKENPSLIELVYLYLLATGVEFSHMISFAYAFLDQHLLQLVYWVWRNPHISRL